MQAWVCELGTWIKFGVVMGSWISKLNQLQIFFLHISDFGSTESWSPANRCFFVREVVGRRVQQGEDGYLTVGPLCMMNVMTSIQYWGFEDV